MVFDAHIMNKISKLEEFNNNLDSVIPSFSKPIKVALEKITATLLNKINDILQKRRTENAELINRIKQDTEEETSTLNFLEEEIDSLLKKIDPAQLIEGLVFFEKSTLLLADGNLFANYQPNKPNKPQKTNPTTSPYRPKEIRAASNHQES